MADDRKGVPQYLSDFSANGESPREQLSLKSAFIKEYGIEKFQELVSRSIRKQSADRTAKR